MVAFTKNELEVFDVKQLKRLGEFYGVEKMYKLRKQELIDAIAEKLGILDDIEEVVVAEDGSPMSVRIRRIHNSQRGG